MKIVGVRFLRFVGVKVGVANFFFSQSIGNDETNTIQLKLLSSMKIVGVTGFRGLWSLGWAWQTFFGSIDRYWVVR